MDLQVKIERVMTAEEKQLLVSCDREIKNLTISSDAEFTNASSVLKALRDEQKALRALRLSVTKPLNDEVDHVMTFFKPYMDKFDRAVTMLSDGMMDYEKRKREAARLEQLRLEEEERQRKEAEEKAKQQEEVVVPARIDTAISQQDIKEAYGLQEVPLTEAKTARVTGLKTVVTWGFKIVDESRIPREYWVLDTAKLNGLARVMQDKLNIPGIEYTKDESFR